jgi:hypothetical protein
MASAVVWNRLEPRPRTNSFTRAIRAEIRDPLWMISRQWQTGEFNADDTGTAVFARIDMQTSKMDRISKKANGNYAPLGDTMPLECMVEREPIVPDLLHCVELGRQFMKLFQARMAVALVSQANMDTALNDVRNSPAVQFKLPNTAVNDPNRNYPEFYSSPELLQATLAIGDGRAIDGCKIIEKLKANQALTSVITLSNAGLNTHLANAGADLLVWYNNTFSEPANANEDYWLHRHLEYQFACSAPKDGSGYTVLSAEEYYQGHLDWYSFNIQDNNPVFAMLANGSPQSSLIEEAPFTVIPSKISFGGMPAQRYWEMEDRRIDPGNLRASTTDTAQLLVAEFNNVYSNDWMLMPYTVPTGTICNLRKVLVTDVFGQTTYISSASNSEWHMFNLTVQNAPATIDKRLFIPPAIQNMEESEPLESVILMRDEMANMVWGIETTVPDGVSTGQPGKDAAQRLVAFLEAETPSLPPVPNVTNLAKIKYNIMTRVPENWIPFTPVYQGPVPGMAAIRLQRAAMPRQILNNLPKGRVRPRTIVLKGESTIQSTPQTLPLPPIVQWSASYIHEEEVPRSGAILSMTWQRARWHNGQVALWLGRRKQNGRGEGNSGLKFDFLTYK